MSSNRPYSLGKADRLKSRKQIDILFGSGKKLNVFPYRLIYRTEPGFGEIKAGFTVSSKNFPRAVDRNRIKRLSRESYRLQKNELESRILKSKSLLHIFFIYTAKEILPYADISARLKQVLDTLIMTIHDIHPENT
jgi:ribonuclease P protein component